MLDSGTENLLGILRRACPVGGYTVIDLADIAPELDAAAEEIPAMLARLSCEGYISLRFSEGDEYCLAVMQKGREYEPKNLTKTPYIAQKRQNLWNIIVAAAAFLGAFLGALSAGLIVGC